MELVKQEIFPMGGRGIWIGIYMRGKIKNNGQ